MVVDSMVEIHRVRASKDNKDKGLHYQTLITSLFNSLSVLVLVPVFRR